MRLEYFDGGQWVVVSTDIASVPVSSKFDFLNGNFKGFRIGHLTNPADTLGTFHLSVLNYISSGENSHYESTRIFTFNNNNNDSFEFLKPVNLSSNFVIAADFNLYNFKIINLAEPTLSTDAATKNYVDTKVNPALYTLDQFSPPVVNLNLNNKKIINVAEPVDFSDSANKGYVDIQTVNTKDYVDSHTWTASQITDFNTQVKANHINDLAAPTGNVNMSMYNVTNVAAPVENNDAATKNYVDSHTWVASNITDLDTHVKAIPLNQFTDPIGDLDINGYKVLNVNFPTLNGDATNKIYVDNAILDVRAYVDNHDWLSGDITGLDSYIKAISLDQFAMPIADINLNSHKVTNVGAPVASADATNKAYVDNHTWTASQVTDLDTHVKAIPLNQFADPLSALDANGFKILNVDLPTLNGDAANKIYVDNHTWSASQVTDLDTYVKTIPLNQFTAPSADVSLNSHKITSLAEPTLSTDAATKNYVDSHAINPTSYSLDQFAPPVADVSMNGKRLYSLPNPTNLTDVTNKSYVDTLVDTTKTNIETWVGDRDTDVSKVAGLDNHVKAIPLNEFAALTSGLNLNKQVTINSDGAALALNGSNYGNYIKFSAAGESLGYIGHASSDPKVLFLTSNRPNGSIVLECDETDTRVAEFSKDQATFNRSVTINNGAISIYSDGGPLALIGTSHCYIQFFPRGTSVGRKAYIGFSSSGSTQLAVVNEDTGGMVLRAGAIDCLEIYSHHALGPHATLNVPLIFSSLYRVQQNVDTRMLHYWGETMAAGNNNFDLKADQILCYQIWIGSSIKLKNKIETTEANIEQEAVSIIAGLPVAKYTKIDENNKKQYLGFIAEEVNENYSDFVNSNNQSFVPNILSDGVVSEIQEDMIVIKLDNIPKKTLEGTRISFATPKSRNLEGELISLENDILTLKLTTKIEVKVGEDVFVLGSLEACPSIDKNNLFEVNIIATKNLLQRVAILESQSTLLMTRNTLLENRLTALESKLANI